MDSVSGCALPESSASCLSMSRDFREFETGHLPIPMHSILTDLWANTDKAAARLQNDTRTLASSDPTTALDISAEIWRIGEQLRMSMLRQKEAFVSLDQISVSLARIFRGGRQDGRPTASSPSSVSYMNYTNKLNGSGESELRAYRLARRARLANSQHDTNTIQDNASVFCSKKQIS